MQYVYLLGFMAVIFGVCWSVDMLCKRLWPKHPGKTVRLPKRTAVFGILLLVLGIAVVFLAWETDSVYFRFGSFLVPAIGLLLAVQYLSFSISYDAEGFVYRSLGKKPMKSAYADILGQKSVIARSGVNSVLYTKNGEVPIYSAQEGVQDFLKTAFAAWCQATGTDPEAVENNPRYLTYFPPIT